MGQLQVICRIMGDVRVPRCSGRSNRGAHRYIQPAAFQVKRSMSAGDGRARLIIGYAPGSTTENFVAAQIVKKMNPSPLKLGMPLVVSIGNGEIIYSDQYVSDHLNLGNYRGSSSVLLPTLLLCVDSLPTVLTSLSSVRCSSFARVPHDLTLGSWVVVCCLVDFRVRSLRFWDL